MRFVLSLTTEDNDYQQEQAAAAALAGRRLGIELQILYANNDPILQSQQLLTIIQSEPKARPNGIILEPVGGTAMPQVARAAATAAIAWVVLNREADYIPDLRRTCRMPVFSLSSDHEEIGRIQGKQIATLLPKGGSALLIQGPSESLAAKQRSAGMYETKPVAVTVKLMKGSWTEVSAYKTVSSWLKLSTSQEAAIDLIAGQDDSMAMGARKAFADVRDIRARDKWLAKPFLGIDGMPKTGQDWVVRGLLAATIITPANSGEAVKMLAESLRTQVMPPEKTLTAAKSFPSLEELAKRVAEKAKAARM
jgi:ribose transport system substrate-binding protein